MKALSLVLALLFALLPIAASAQSPVADSVWVTENEILTPVAGQVLAQTSPFMMDMLGGRCFVLANGTTAVAKFYIELIDGTGNAYRSQPLYVSGRSQALLHLQSQVQQGHAFRVRFGKFSTSTATGGVAASILWQTCTPGVIEFRR